jgi:uncharacterized delta-60 repeat protein
MTPLRSFAASCGLLLFVPACGSVTSATDAGDDDAPPLDAGPPDAAPTLSLTLGRDAVTAPTDIEVEIAVTIARGGFDGDVVVDAPALAGTTVAPLTIPAGADTGTFVIGIDGTGVALAGTGTLVVTAHAPGDAATGEDSLELTVVPGGPAFDVQWPSGVENRALWTLPGWTVPASIELSTRGGFEGVVTARWTDLPAGSTSDAVETALDTSDTSRIVPFTTGATAPIGTGAATLIVSDGTLRQTITADVRVGPPPGLDPAVGTDGRIEVDVSAFTSEALPREIEVDSVGRLIVVADTPGDRDLVVRLTAAGAIDTTFNGGVASVTMAGLSFVDGDVDGSDRVVVAGVRNGSLCAMRFAADGTLDGTFTGCTSAVSFLPAAIRVRPTGKTVMAGSAGGATMIRLDTDGSVDTAFTAPVLAATTQFDDLAVDSSGRFIAVGSDGDVALVARFTSAGALDTSFDGDGWLTFSPLGRGARATAVTIADDGDLVVAGNFVLQANLQAPSKGSVIVPDVGFVARFDTTGAADATFGEGGAVMLDGSAGDLDDVRLGEIRESSALGITVYGVREEYGGTGTHLLRARLDATGAPVAGFGAAGYDWLLGGGAFESLDAARFTSTGAWLAARTGTGTFVLVKEASL